MENSKIYSDEDWLKTPLICGALSNIPVDIRWEIWENLALTNEEKVPIYKYWAEQFSGDPVTDEEIEVSGDVLVYPDEGDYRIRPARLYMPVTAQGVGFILYGEPYQDPYNPYAK